MSNNNRQSNMELLRILSIIGVLFLHYNDPTYGAAYNYTIYGSINLIILDLFQAFSICAVNVFILISGYFLVNSNTRSLFKPVKLLFEVFFITIVNYAYLVASGKYYLSLLAYLYSVSTLYWFIGIYISLYLISPFINVIVNNINRKSMTVLVILLVVLFSIQPTAIDLTNFITDDNFNYFSNIGYYGSQAGFTIVNFVMMYTIGGVLRACKDRVTSVPKSRYLLGYIILSIIVDFVNQFTSIAIAYSTPVIVAQATMLFCFFMCIDLGSSKIINFLSASTFTVYCTHIYFFPLYNIPKYATATPLISLVHVVLTVFSIYLICTVFHFLYSLITEPVFNKLRPLIEKTKYKVE